LLDEVRNVRVRGRTIDIISPRWSGRGDASVNAGVQRLLTYRRNDAFAILLAHHPHSFDAAAAAAIPLTLAGHTHGGQLALTRNIGIGPMMYRYWSGEYRQDQSACMISNGAGNWFPLRINVPCEIIHITLRTT
ncbi:MAG: hypothetical protein H7144_17330, partial [Burkholderiales bacterium]|nr:hypothetical protein [Phycisphaerae bacterium]